MLGVVDFGGSRGRGVVALRSFNRGDLVETAHCIYIERDQVDLANSIVLREYTFTCGKKQDM